MGVQDLGLDSSLIFKKESMSSFFYYMIMALGVWRITNLLMYEEGPYTLFGKLRTRIGKKSELAKIFSCFWCLSIWVGVLVTVGICFRPDWTFTICLPFGLSAIAIILAEAFAWHAHRIAHS